MESDARIPIGEQHTCEGCGTPFNFSFMDGRSVMTTYDSFMKIEVKWRCPECDYENTITPFLGWPYSPARTISADDFVKVATVVQSVFNEEDG